MKQIYTVTFLLSILLAPFKQVIPQTGIPGVTNADYDKFTDIAMNIWGSNYFGFGIINVDSSLGELAVSNGKIQDPYGTLKNCYIFMVAGEKKGLHTPKGGICIYNYKNDWVVWYSDTLIYNYNIMAAYTYATRDLTNDGNVEIITSWVYSHHFGPKYLWIFSWDGQTGELISAIDHEEKQSVLYTDTRSGFSFVDVDGDGIIEIQGYPDNDMDHPVTWSWNGQMYGKWPDTPQPSGDTFLPRDRVHVSVHANVEKKSDGLIYSYLIESKTTSIQDIDEIILDCHIDSVKKSYTRKNWRFYLSVDILGWVNAKYPPKTNYILPGETDTSCAFESSGLPKIVKYYIRGYNKRPSGQYSGDIWWRDVQENSATGFTIGAAYPPDPFISSDFLDTLMTYPQRSFDLDWIDNHDIRNSMNKKLENAKKQLDEGKTKQAVNIINAFINEVDAQKGKHINSEAYALLKYNAEYLVEKLEE